VIAPGTFTPPPLGRRHVPFPVVGAGRLEVVDGGLRVVGTRARFAGLSSILGVVGLVGGFVLATMLGLESRRAIGGVVFGGLFAGAAIGHLISKRISNRPLELSIPWASVRKVDVLDGELQILVKRFRPEGMIHFRTVNPTAIAAAVASRLRA
jgi:hypothetical protein